MELYKGNNRYRLVRECPCGKSNHDGKFVPFVINGTPSPEYGYCFSCGKTFYPNGQRVHRQLKKYPRENYKPNKIVSEEKIIDTLKDDGRNNFIFWLKQHFLNNEVKKAVFNFNIGTGRMGNTIFWQKDIQGNYLTGKSIFYGKDGHRLKDKPIFSLYPKTKGYGTCVFGEHQLKSAYLATPIVLVESEKDAIVGHLAIGKFIWLATGGANSLKNDKLNILKDRKVILHPHCDDAGRKGFDKIYKKLKTISYKVIIQDIDLQINDGTDISDVLCK